MVKQTYDNYYREYFKKNKERISKFRRERYQEAALKYRTGAAKRGVRTYTTQWKMWYRAKKRAEKLNLPFSITDSDIIIPTHCPLLGLELKEQFGKGGHWACSPSLDRIIPDQGYVPGNIAVISMKANRMKQEITPEFLKKLSEYFSKYQKSIAL